MASTTPSVDTDTLILNNVGNTEQTYVQSVSGGTNLRTVKSGVNKFLSLNLVRGDVGSSITDSTIEGSVLSGVAELTVGGPSATAVRIKNVRCDTTGNPGDVATRAFVESSSTGFVVWKNVWLASATPYSTNDMCQSEGWLMVANKETDERPDPQSIGEPFDVYDGPELNSITSPNSKSILFGMRYSIPTSGYLTGYRVRTVIGNTYVIYSVLNPTGPSPIITEIIRFTAVKDDWQFFALDTFINTGTVFDVVTVVFEPDDAPMTTIANYNYITPNNASVPGSGQITHADKELSSLRINVTDDDLIDRTSLLMSISSGDIIVVGDLRWSVQGDGIAVGSYYTFSVAPAVQWASDGVQAFSFEVVASVPITYHQNIDYWVADPNVKGLLSLTGDYDEAIASPNDTQYGLDIQVQQALVSEDWDFAAHSDNVSSGSPVVEHTFNNNMPVSSISGTYTTEDVLLYEMWLGTSTFVASSMAFFVTTADVTTTIQVGIYNVDGTQLLSEGTITGVASTGVVTATLTPAYGIVVGTPYLLAIHLQGGGTMAIGVADGVLSDTTITGSSPYVGVSLPATIGARSVSTVAPWLAVLSS